MINKIYEKIKQFIKENYKFLIVLLFLFVFFFYELPFVIYRPGGTIDLEDRIEIADEKEQSGTLSMAYVSMMKGNIPFVLLSFVIPNWDLESAKTITIGDESVDDTIKRDRLYLEEGLDNAVLSAYKLAGKDVTINAIHQVIVFIDENAQTDLQVGDMILKIDQQEFATLNELQSYIGSKQKDDTVEFLVKRDKKEVTCQAKVYELDGEQKVGISIINKYEYDTNPDIEIKTKESESGSSGGLMTALSIYNGLTDEDITKGRDIVGTGTIDALGNVGEIGGVKYKILGAAKKKADIFLTPKENYEEAKSVKEENNLDITILAVSSLEEAISLLNE